MTMIQTMTSYLIPGKAEDLRRSAAGSSLGGVAGFIIWARNGIGIGAALLAIAAIGAAFSGMSNIICQLIGIAGFGLMGISTAMLYDAVSKAIYLMTPYQSTHT